MPIRSARPEDAEAVARVRVTCWQTAYAVIVPDTFRDPAFITQFVARRQGRLPDPQQEFCFVAEDEQEQIAGYAIGGPALDPTSAYAGELYEVYVLPSAQKQGSGRKLTLHVACELLKRGYPSMRLYVLAENAKARRFYERLGGVVFEERTVELGGRTVRDVAYGWGAISQIPGIQCE
jgi:ribosomal protein S18 acetylase RimI-like enzyme